MSKIDEFISATCMPCAAWNLFSGIINAADGDYFFGILGPSLYLAVAISELMSDMRDV